MKKIFLSLVFLFGVGTFVMADDTMKVKNDTVTVEDGFKKHRPERGSSIC